MHATAVRANDRMIAGPAPGRSALPAVAVPMAAKIPVPMTAPMPSIVRAKAGSVRFSVWSAAASGSRVIRSTLFVRNRARRFIPGALRVCLVRGTLEAAALYARVLEGVNRTLDTMRDPRRLWNREAHLPGNEADRQEVVNDAITTSC